MSPSVFATAASTNHRDASNRSHNDLLSTAVSVSQAIAAFSPRRIPVLKSHDEKARQKQHGAASGQWTGAEDTPADAGDPQAGESYLDVGGISTFDTRIVSPLSSPVRFTTCPACVRRSASWFVNRYTLSSTTSTYCACQKVHSVEFGGGGEDRQAPDGRLRPAGLCSAREFFAIAIEGRRSCREFRPFAASTTFVGWSVSVELLAVSIGDSADEGSWPSGQAARRSYR